MALMERVATLVRANLNELIDRAEDPDKMLKQVILDMQNQLMQVKTQVAIALADQHLLAKKQTEHESKVAEWERKAEYAVDKKDDELARAALQRSVACRAMADDYRHQMADQAVQVENLKAALVKLQEKMAEAQAKSDLMLAQHRRARAVTKTTETRRSAEDAAGELALSRVKNKVDLAEAVSRVATELNGESVEDRLAALEKHDEIERLLAGIKARRA